MSTLRALVLLLVIAPSVSAQEDPHAHHALHLMAAQVGWVEREVLERPVPLRQGIGVLHDPATTASAEAQKFYDQGLAYLHSYVWIEAARSFHQALRHDSRLALAHWGLSRTYSGLEDPEAARRAWERATELAAGASERERRRIAARGVQLEAIAEPASVEKHAAYKKALDAALAIDFADPELWLLRGNAEEPTALGRGQRGSAASVAFYERALKLVPDHFPAHHYLVHSYETIGRIDDALRHGEVFARLAPEIPHAQHMYGHDLRRVGRMQEAIERFEETDRLERAYYASEGIAAEADWHHAHNLDLLATCYQHLGQMRKAEDLMRESWALDPATDTLEFNKKEWPAFLLGRGRAEEALAAARALARGRSPAARAAGHVYSGHALLALDRSAEAKTELAAAERELEALSPISIGISPSRPSVEPYVEGLRGEILLRQGDGAAARPLFEGVARKARAIHGPDAWIQALFRLEAMARVAREAGDHELAAAMARHLLEHDPAYAGAHYAAALAAEARADRIGAQRELAEVERLWRDADPDLPELLAARRLLAQLARAR